MRISDWSSDVCSSDLAKAGVMVHAERRGELVQFGHAVGARALEADDDDHVAIEFAGLEGILHLLLIAEHARGRLDRPAILLDRADLDARAADIAREDAHDAFVLERRGDGADDAVVDRGVGQIAPYP